MKMVHNISRLIAFVTLAACAGFSSACLHARVEIRESTQALPECAAAEQSKTDFLKQEACRKAAALLESRRKKAPEPVVLHHNFYLWGLVPSRVTVKGEEICPDGVAEVYGYSTWTDELFNNLTAGLYCPRSLRITCARSTL